jgi:N-methylhydantoinase A
VFERSLPQPAPLLGTHRRDATALSAWAELPAQGEGPKTLFAALTTVWVPEGWRWTRLPDDSLALDRVAPSPAQGMPS